MARRLTLEGVLRRGKRYARRARRRTRRTRRLVVMPVAMVRDAKQVRARNAAFFQGIETDDAGGRVRADVGALRSLAALRERVQLAKASPVVGRLLGRGALAWASPRAGLRSGAVAAGWEALEAEEFELAQWIADAMNDRTRSREVQLLQAAVAARQADWARALTWTRHRYPAPAGEPTPQARNWVNRASHYARIEPLLRDVQRESGQEVTSAVMLAEGPERLWAEADDLASSAAAARAAIAAPGPLGARYRYLDAFVADQVARGGDLERLRPVFEEYSAARRHGVVTFASTEVGAAIRTMSVQTFRTYLTGKSICLVANSPRLLGSGLGATIDGYDLVMRFNSFVIEPADTGARTDIHVTIHMHDYNWNVHVPVRIVLSGQQELWRESLKVRLRPGAQDWLGDATLRWPARDLGLISPKDPFRTPTAGFNLLRLLLHLDVSSRIDLIGFDFYETGKLRVGEAMKIPHSTAHDSGSERDWVMKHAVRSTDMVISMLEERGVS